MTQRKPIFERGYSANKPFVRARIAIINPRTGELASFEERCWVDTGFDGGIHVPNFRRSEATMVGIIPSLATLTLAGGTRVPGSVCLAFLQQIENYKLPPPGIETELIIQGTQDYGLLGLEILKNWIAQFDGPRKTLSFYT